MNNKKQLTKKEKASFLAVGFFPSLNLVTELGFLLSFPIVGGVFLGLWLDGRFGSKPTLTLIFLFLGVVISFLNLFRIVKKFSINK